MDQKRVLLDATAEPGISVTVLEAEVPTVTVATIVGISVVVLLAIVAVFVIGVLIDCRQQKILDQKMGQIKRLRKLRFANRNQSDRDVIANNMEEPGTSIPPAAALRNIP